jgi:hypothetical protein
MIHSVTRLRQVSAGDRLAPITTQGILASFIVAIAVLAGHEAKPMQANTIKIMKPVRANQNRSDNNRTVSLVLVVMIHLYLVASPKGFLV